MNSDNTIIGIDLGTTYSCVGIWINGKVEIIANDEGERTTPSWVSFTDLERCIGQGAKQNQSNAVFDSKRMLGKSFDDPTLQNDIKHWPFKVVNKDNKPYIQVQYKNEIKEFSPEEISAMILYKMKETAENYLGYPVKKAVVTVPAYFNDYQRRATKDAGLIAGLDIQRIINEPTAAAMAYGLDKEKESTVLIFDLGGGTMDCSVLTLNDGLFEVKSTSGNNHMGGEDFDNRIIVHCLKEFYNKNKNIDIKELMQNKKVLTKLRSVAEKAKKILSTNVKTVIEVDSLYNNIDFSIPLTRAKFEELCHDDFEKCMEPVKQALIDAKMSKDDITDIVLVGGSTRIPKIRELLKNYFGKELKQDINPDEAVAYGAAIQGAILSKVNDAKINSLVLIDILPLSLGIETAGGSMAKIIIRGSQIPCSKEQTFSTYSDNQPAVTVKIYEGEREFTKFNNLLGSFELLNIPPMPRGIPKIIVKFDVDANGILNVTALEESSNKSNKITIKNDDNRISPEKLEEMINESLKYKEDDLREKEKLIAKNELENYIYNIRNSLTDEFKELVGEENSKMIMMLITNGLQWLESDRTKADYNDKKKELENQIKPIFMEAYKK